MNRREGAGGEREARPNQGRGTATSTSVILALLLLTQAGWFVWRTATNSPTIDFFTFWSIPHDLSRKPVANIYLPDGQRALASVAVAEALSPAASNLQRQATAMVLHLYNGRIDAPGSPFLYAAIGWLSSGDFATDQKRFMLICSLCLVASVLLLNNLLRFTVVDLILLVTFLSWAYEPVLSDARVGNVGEIQLLAISLFIVFMARSRLFLAGLTIGAATAFKPTTAVVLALGVIALLADRDYRQLLRMLAGSLIAVSASVLAAAAYFRNPATWLDFIRSLHGTLNGASYPVENGNFSLSMLLFGANQGWAAGILLVLLVAFSWLLFATRRRGAGSIPILPVEENEARRRFHTAFAVGGAGCAIMLLSSPLVWLHYYLLLLPLSLYVMRPVSEPPYASSSQNLRFWRGIVLLLPFVLLLTFSFAAYQIVGDRPRLMCVLVILATLSTLVLAAYYIWQQRSAANGPKTALAS